MLWSYICYSTLRRRFRRLEEPVQHSKLTAQNTYLTEMLKQAGLDAEARDVAERIQTVLTDEIHHRMKNMLTMVTAIVRQSMRASASLTEAEAAISLRLLAMARAHDLLLKADWKAAGLREVVQGAIAQHDTAAGRILLAGDDIQINSAAILPLTLTLNELCTNAIKYGALSNETGRGDDRLAGGPGPLHPALGGDRRAAGQRSVPQQFRNAADRTGASPPAGRHRADVLRPHRRGF